MTDPTSKPGFSDFVAETHEMLEAMERCLMNFDSSKSTVDELFRSAHTIKGTSAMYGFPAISEFMHTVESCLDEIRTGHAVMNDPLRIQLLAARDFLLEWIMLYESGHYEDEEHISLAEQITGKIKSLAFSSSQREPGIVAQTTEAKKDTSNSTQRNKLRTLRVDAEKLDIVVDRVAEAVVIGSAIHQIALGLKNEYLEELSHRMTRILTEVRSNSLKLRMIPVETLFSRFNRVAYELSLNLKKPVRFITRGGDTQLDKNVIDHLTDPVLHMIRNAFDHGIEEHDERIRSGKPEEATISLSAHHQAGLITITVSDDGRGMDVENIRRKAIRNGLCKQDDILTEEQILRFTLEPGFTTADSVTDLSGRGVGMDVVRKNIDSLRGEINIVSRKGAGTTIQITLPLTLANIDGFLLRIGANQYAIPLDMVNECMEFSGADLVIGEQNFVRVRGEVIPFIDMREFFEEPAALESESRRNLVIVHSGNTRAALIVDELLGRVHSVIKPAGDLFESTNGIDGFAVLGDGNVALIIDTSLLMNRVRELNDESTGKCIENALAVNE